MKKIAPYIILAVGIIFALQSYGVVAHAFAKLWPILIIMYGLGLIIQDYSM